MELVLIEFAAVSVVELALWLPPFWRWRKPIAGVLVITLSLISGLLVGSDVAAWTLLILFFNVYRVTNLLRLIEGRTASDYLFRVARRSSWNVIAWQAAVLGLASLNHIYDPSPVFCWSVVAGLQLLVAGIVLSSTVRHLKTTRPLLNIKPLADRDLPSLTVAIPARNETEDLEACLQSLLASNYPKLEILVLDDCSQDKRTPEIIRGLAHGGVRFLSGEIPPEHWLAKNFAYQQLAHEANGDLLLFCGVDTRFEPDSLRLLVESLLAKKKSMMSVLPKNNLPGNWSLEQVMIQPFRYAWEISLPRRWLNRPPVLSTCWIITSEALHTAGGFKAVANANSPESYFARAVAKHDGYSFLASDLRLGISCQKALADQRDTAVRTRYPQLHRRPELAGLLTLVELFSLVGPFVLAIAAAITGHWPLTVVGLITSAGVIISYGLVVELTYRRNLLRGLWLLPFAAIYDIGLLNYSLWQYEFGEVIWKGRNVCMPIMRAIPSLPKLE